MDMQLRVITFQSFTNCRSTENEESIHQTSKTQAKLNLNFSNNYYISEELLKFATHNIYEIAICLTLIISTSEK